jgi:hypothetical protein
MKLAPATLSIVRVGSVDHAGTCRGRSNANILLRSNSVQFLRIWRHSGALIARWRVSPETGRPECRWSLDERSADDQLWPGPNRARRRWHQRPRHSPRRRPPSLVSQTCQQTYDHCDLTALGSGSASA